MCDLILYPPNVFQFDLVHKENNSSEVKLKKENVLKKNVVLFYFSPNLACFLHHLALCSVNTKHTAVSLHSDSPTSLNIRRFPQPEEKLWTTSHIQRRRRKSRRRGGEQEEQEEEWELAHGYQGVSTPCWLWLHHWDICPLVDPPSNPPPNPLQPIQLLQSTNTSTHAIQTS